MHLTCTGAITAQGPPSNCSNAVDSDSLKTNPVKLKKKGLYLVKYVNKHVYVHSFPNK